MPIILALLRLKQENSSEFQGSLGYRIRLLKPLQNLFWFDIRTWHTNLKCRAFFVWISSILSWLKNLSILYKMTVTKKEVIIYLIYSSETCPGGVLTLICGKMPCRLAARLLSTGLCQQGWDGCCTTFGRKPGKRWLDWLLPFACW